MHLFLAKRSILHLPIQLPAFPEVTPGERQPPASQVGTPFTPIPLTILCPGLNGTLDWKGRFDIIIRNEGSLPGYGHGPVLWHQDVVEHSDLAVWPAATDHEYGIQQLVQHEGSTLRWQHLKQRYGMDDAQIAQALQRPRHRPDPCPAHVG